MEYTVVTSKQRERLKKAVNKRIGEGWGPCGGIAAFRQEHADWPETMETVWAQAMIRDEASKCFHEMAAAKKESINNGKGA